MSWSMSPIQTPSKARRSCHSDYETAGEDDDSDSSIYYSLVDMEQTLENKENSLNISSKSAKRSAKGGSAATPLLRKTLKKNLVEVSMMSQQATIKHVTFNSVVNDIQAETLAAASPSDVTTETNTKVEPAAESNAKVEPAAESNAKDESENANASGMTDEVCDITVLETGAAAVIEPTACAQKSVSFVNAEIKVIVSDFDDPHKKPMLMASSRVALKDNKRLSVSLTKKTIKTANTNASVRNHRQQLAVEAKKVMPTKNARTSIVKRSSMYQPRKSSVRRSIEATIVARANKTWLETEAAFADESPATSAPAEEPKPAVEESVSITSTAITESKPTVEDSVPITSTGIKEPHKTVSSKIEERKLHTQSTSIQSTKSAIERKELVKKGAAKELNQPKQNSATANAAPGNDGFRFNSSLSMKDDPFRISISDLCHSIQGDNLLIYLSQLQIAQYAISVHS